jgi:hypothetical protein
MASVCRPLLSLLVPLFNGATSSRRRLQSTLDQDYRPIEVTWSTLDLLTVAEMQRRQSPPGPDVLKNLLIAGGHALHDVARATLVVPSLRAGQTHGGTSLRYVGTT